MPPNQPKLLAFDLKSALHLPGCGLQVGKNEKREFVLSAFRIPDLVPDFRADMDARVLVITTKENGAKFPPRQHVIPFENVSKMVFEPLEAKPKRATKPKPTDTGATTKATSEPAKDAPAK